jgi:protein CWC15
VNSHVLHPIRIRSKYKDDFEDDVVKEDDAWSDLDGDDSDSDDSDESDEDDEAALQAELEKIRAEREAAKRKEEEEANVMKEKELEEEAMVGNPLLGIETKSSKLKRKWNDDVVFRNQARGEPEVQKRFINDTIRNDFHKRFLNKFIR